MLAVGAKLGVSSATVCRRAVVLVPLLEPETGREALWLISKPAKLVPF
jgi:hypothetical protein